MKRTSSVAKKRKDCHDTIVSNGKISVVTSFPVRNKVSAICQIDISPAGKFYLARTEDMIHPGINNDGQHLPWRRQISLYPLIGLFQCRNLHTSNTVTKQADGVIFSYLNSTPNPEAFKPRDYLFAYEKGLLHVTLRATAPFLNRHISIAASYFSILSLNASC